MKKKTTLYIPATLNGSWLLVSIDVALWLNKSDGFKEVTIICVSNYNIFNFFNLFLRLKNISSYFSKDKLKKLWNLVKSSKSSKSQNIKFSELASFATGRSDQASLIIDDLEIKFGRVKADKKNSILSFITLSHRVIVDYLNYFRRSSLKNRTYLEYKVADVYAGLHVLSEALRSDYKSRGSVFHCRLGILVALYKLHSSLIEYKKIILPKDSVAFVCGPDQEYIYGFFSRFMFDRGAFFIEASNLQHPYIKRELKEKHYSRIKISQTGSDNQHLEKEKITDYYQSRIDRIWEVFNYKQEKYTPSKEKLNLDGVSVVVYLHSFTDAQYVWGYDGYHDLMDWCISTISTLNSNKYVSNVIVKTHPESTSSYHPGDSIANRYLKSQLSSFDKVQWADFHFSVKQLNNSETVVGITHHGSVAEELTFNKIPVIGSAHSFWGNNYKFGYWWNNPKEYDALISGKLITELVVTKTQIDELYRYAMDFHFSKDSHNFFTTGCSWKDMFRIYKIEDRQEFGENMEQVKFLVSQLDPNDREFKEYIATRLKRINLLNDVCKNNIAKT